MPTKKQKKVIFDEAHARRIRQAEKKLATGGDPTVDKAFRKAAAKPAK